MPGPTIARQLDQLYEIFKFLVETVGLDASFQFNSEDGAFVQVSKSDMDDPTNAGSLIATMMFKEHLHLEDQKYSYRIHYKKSGLND